MLQLPLIAAGSCLHILSCNNIEQHIGQQPGIMTLITNLHVLRTALVLTAAKPMSTLQWCCQRYSWLSLSSACVHGPLQPDNCSFKSAC